MMLTAHSGSDGTPDNSQIFLDSMLQEGIACVEVDVQQSEEGMLYLSHDRLDHFEKALGLADALQILNKHSKCLINCDLKTPNCERAVLDLAQQFNLQERIIFSGTVDLENLPSRASRKQVYLNVESIIPEGDHDGEYNQGQIAEIIRFCLKNGIETLNVNHERATASFIDQLHQAGLALSLWTVNDFSEISRFRRSGIKSVTSRRAVQYTRQFLMEGGI